MKVPTMQNPPPPPPLPLRNPCCTCNIGDPDNPILGGYARCIIHDPNQTTEDVIFMAGSRSGKTNEFIKKLEQKINDLENENSKLRSRIIKYQPKLINAKIKADHIYRRMWSYADYQQVNGVEKKWIIEKIAQGLIEYREAK